MILTDCSVKIKMCVFGGASTRAYTREQQAPAAPTTRGTRLGCVLCSRAHMMRVLLCVVGAAGVYGVIFVSIYVLVCGFCSCCAWFHPSM